MYKLSKIDLGRDEAEQDIRLKEYFLKTPNYQNALLGLKTIIIGRKGSGKSAIFTLMKDELQEQGSFVIPITPDQYSWGTLKEYKELGILSTQAHTNAWKTTLLSSIIWIINQKNLVKTNSQIRQYHKYFKNQYSIDDENWFFDIVEKSGNLLRGIKLEALGASIGFDFNQKKSISIPLKVNENLQKTLLAEIPGDNVFRIIIDRLDDSWDNSQESRDLIIGLLKAANDINARFNKKVIVTVFLRSDIYDHLYFDDQDKLRQNEEILYWNTDELKSIVSERVKVSLNITTSNYEKIWRNLFSDKSYRSKATSEKYIIDRTFKRPRDIISFVRYALEIAIRNNHNTIEPQDTRLAEEENYSQSKYKDLIIEYQKQFPYIKDLLDHFSGCLHKFSKVELQNHITNFKDQYHQPIQENPIQILRNLFTWGVIGIKRQGRSGVKQRGGTHFYYYYDDPSINPLNFNDYYIHPSLRYHLNISEKREKTKKPELPPEGDH